MRTGSALSLHHGPGPWDHVDRLYVEQGRLKTSWEHLNGSLAGRLPEPVSTPRIFRELGDVTRRIHLGAAPRRTLMLPYIKAHITEPDVFAEISVEPDVLLTEIWSWGEPSNGAANRFFPSELGMYTPCGLTAIIPASEASG